MNITHLHHTTQLLKASEPFPFGANMTGSARIQYLPRNIWVANYRGSDSKWNNWLVWIWTIHLWTLHLCDVCFRLQLLAFELRTINFSASFLFAESTLVLLQTSPRLRSSTITFAFLIGTPSSYSQCPAHMLLEDSLPFRLSSWLTRAADISL